MKLLNSFIYSSIRSDTLDSGGTLVGKENTIPWMHTSAPSLRQRVDD